MPGTFFNLWIGTYDKGLNRLTDGKFSIVTKESGFEAHSVRVILEDSGKRLWVGTYGRGIFIMDPGTSRGTFKRLPSPRNVQKDNKGIELTSDHVFAIYEDRAGGMWIGTDGGGLNYFKDNKVTVYNKKNGLRDNSINHIIEDKHGFFWMSGNKGITRVNKKQLYDFISGKIPKVNVMLLGKGDGMKSAACNGTFQPAGWMDKAGKIWFPTTGGIVRVDPDNLETNTLKPPVYIEKVVVDGSVVEPGPGLVLEPGVKKVEIHYTAVSLTDPRSMAFKTMLEGFDAGWQSTGDRKDRIATYTSIPHGDYTFRVIASNNDGVWNEKGVSLNISVNAPFWLQWWFLLAAAVVFSILSYTGISYLKRLVTVVRFWKKKNYIGIYKLVDQIGSGGMATIHKAVTGKGPKKSTVALKLMKDEYTFDPMYRKRFLTEGQIIDKIEHPHIVKIFDRGEHNHRLFIAMELLEGMTLDQVITENAPMSPGECVGIVIQVLEALKEIHGAGIIHRDMKPGDIFLEDKGDGYFIKILDFGLAKSEAVSRVTETGLVVGTLNYLSPEQLLNSKYSSASDIYALGVIFYEMLTGEKPYRGETALERIQAILRDPLKEPKAINKNIPGKLSGLVKVMMAREPEARPNAESLLLALNKLASRL